MRILQFNVRLAEDEAAGVVLDLHLRLLEKGLSSWFIYGYGKGDKKSANHTNSPQVIKCTPRLTSAAGIALLRFMNRDMFDGLNKLYREVARTFGSLILHFHALCSYWLNLEEVVTFCQKVKVHKPDITFVWTLHDYWSVTGRHALIDGCKGWKAGYQRCLTLSNYLSIKVDRAHQQLPGKWQMSRTMLTLGCQFVSLSQHVADVFDSLYGIGRCRTISNGIDVATEAILGELLVIPAESDRPKIVVVAHDLRYDGKTDQQLARAIAVLEERIELHTFDKFPPFARGDIINHGFGGDKRTLMGTPNQIDRLVFSSHVDNYPLILYEALSIGVPIITIHSDAAQEVPAKSGGKTFSEADVLRLVQLRRSDVAQAVSGTSLTAFSQRSRVAYSGQQMLEKYISFHQNLQLFSATAALSTG